MANFFVIPPRSAVLGCSCPSRLSLQHDWVRHRTALRTEGDAANIIAALIGAAALAYVCTR